MKTVGTFIVGEQNMLQAGFMATLRASSFRVCRQLQHSSDFSAILRVAKPSSLFLVFQSIDNQRSAQRSVEALREAFPHSFVVLVSPKGAEWAMEGTVDGCLPQDISARSLLLALELLMSKEVSVGLVQRPDCAPVSSSIGDLPTAKANCLSSGLLTSREREVLDCVAMGQSNKRIAKQLSIGEATVKGHIRAVLRKIGVSNRTQAALWAQSAPTTQQVDELYGAVHAAVWSSALLTDGMRPS